MIYDIKTLGLAVVPPPSNSKHQDSSHVFRRSSQRKPSFATRILGAACPLFYAGSVQATIGLPPK